MPLDASIYGNIQPPANLLTQYSNALGVANQMQQNQLLQTQNQKAKLDTQLQQAQIVAGQILADHINPDGSTDFVGATQDPRYKGNAAAQPLIFDQMQKALEGTNNRVPDGNGGYIDQPSSAQDALIARNRQAALGITGKLIAQGNQGDITDKHLNDASVDLMTDAGVPAKVVAAALPNMPEDPAGRLQAAKQSYSAMLVHKMQHVSQDEAQGGGVYNTQASPLAGKNVNAGVPVTAMADISANQARGQTQYDLVLKNGQNAITLADNAKLAQSTLENGVDTGSLAPAIAKMKGVVSSLGGNIAGVTSDKAGYDLLVKELARVSAGQGGEGGTDYARSLKEAQNADITKSAPAVRKVLQYVQANAEAQKGTMLAMQHYLGANPSGEDINEFLNGNPIMKDAHGHPVKDADGNPIKIPGGVTNNMDPAIFRFPLMSPEEKRSYALQNFSGPAGEARRQVFIQKADALKKLGVLDGIGQ